MIRGEVLITLSPDGNCIPEAIPLLLDKMEEGYDMVVASRYAPGAAAMTTTGSPGSAILSLPGHATCCTTATTPMRWGYRRPYKTKLIYDLELDQHRWHRVPEKLFFTRISWEPLLSARATRRRLKVCEIPVREPARIGGVRELQILRWGAAYYYQFIRDWFLFR